MVDQPTAPSEPIKPRSKRFVVWLIVVIVAAGAIVGGVYWFMGLLDENREAKQLLQLQDKAIAEVRRCNTLFQQNQGQFDEYEYCKKFVQEFGGMLSE